MQKITMDVIAKNAGVSKSTVSYVLTGKKKVSKDVEERVLKIARELNYIPNSFTLQSEEQRLKTVGFYVPLLDTALSQDLFYISVVEGAMDSLNQAGYHLIFERIDVNRSMADFSFSDKGKIDGVILMNPSTNDVLLETLKQENVPFVLIGTPSDKNDERSIFFIDVDGMSAAYQVTDFLCSKGHEKIFYINGPAQFLHCIQKEEGFKLAHEKKNLPWNPDFHINRPITRDAGYEACMTILDKGIDCTAIATVNECVARGVLDALQERKIKIPREMSVIAMGGSIEGEMVNPKITTIDFSPKKMGQEAAQMLIEIITNKRIKPSHILLSAKLVERVTV